MTDRNIQALYTWLDPHENKHELEETLKRLTDARKPRDIAFRVVSHLQGVGKVNSVTAVSAAFIQTLVDLAPNFVKGKDDVAAVSYHMRAMIRDLEWQRKETEQEKERLMGNTKKYLIVIKRVREGQRAMIENYLYDNDVEYSIVSLSDFDGNADYDETLLQIEGTAEELHDVLKDIGGTFGTDVLEELSLTSEHDRISKESLTLWQTLSLLKDEQEIQRIV